MKGMIGFKNLRIFCIIGVYPEEHLQEQEIFVDLQVEVDFGADSLSETVDYDKLAKLCQGLVQKNQYQLIETFASDALKELSNRFPILFAKIKVKKPAAIPSADYTFVELEWAGH